MEKVTARLDSGNYRASQSITPHPWQKKENPTKERKRSKQTMEKPPNNNRNERNKRLLPRKRHSFTALVTFDSLPTISTPWRQNWLFNECILGRESINLPLNSPLPLSTKGFPISDKTARYCVSWVATIYKIIKQHPYCFTDDGAENTTPELADITAEN